MYDFTFPCVYLPSSKCKALFLWTRWDLGLATVATMVPGTREADMKQDLRPAFQLLADELMYLDRCGHDMVDGRTGQSFTCYMRLAAFGSDLRGLEKALHISSTPSKCACLKCWTEGLKLPGRGGKTIYPGTFRWAHGDTQLIGYGCLQFHLGVPHVDTAVCVSLS